MNEVFFTITGTRHYHGTEFMKEGMKVKLEKDRHGHYLDSFLITIPDVFEGDFVEEETFSEMLLRLIDERGLKDSTVYRKTGVDG